MIAGRLLLTAALVVAPSAAPTKTDDVDIPCVNRGIAACNDAITGPFAAPLRGWCYIAATYSCLAS